MKSKIQVSIFFIILGVIALIIGVYYFGIISNLVYDVPSGCQKISTIEYTTGSYTCQSDYCIVSAYMKVDKPMNKPILIFKPSDITYGTNSYFNIYFEGNWQKWIRSGSTYSQCIGSYTGITTKEGFRINIYYGSTWTTMVICKGGNANPGFKLYSAATDSRIPTGAPGEVTDAAIFYEAYWNLCPSVDSNYPFCSGKANDKVTSEGDWYTTNAIYPTDTQKRKLSKGESISFSPVNKDGSTITNKKLFIETYDCSCIPAVNAGTACSSGMKKCFVTSTKTCPTGYTPFTGNKWCPGSGAYFDNACTDNKGSFESCVNPINLVDDTAFTTCDSNQTLPGGSVCGAFGTAVGHCGNGQKCIVTATGTTGNGIGNCGCFGSCTLNSRTKTSSNSYNQCEMTGVCPSQVQHTCDATLVYDESVRNSLGTLGDCVCPVGGNECSNPSEPSSCPNSDTSRKCVSYQNGNRQCYHYSDTSCLGEKKCSGGSCSCSAASDCVPSENKILCMNSTTYKSCAMPLSEPNGCYKMRDVGNTCGDLFKCTNNQCIERNDVGCAYPSSPDYNTKYKCNDKVVNGILLESCVDNTCMPIQDIYTASESDYIPTPKTHCIGNAIYNVKKYDTRDNIIYRWELSTTCGGDTPVCTEL